MIDLYRSKDAKWILQKNVSSKDIITAYLECIKDTHVDYLSVLKDLRNNDIYRGRSAEGAVNTMGVRFSQMCFYMFGYQTEGKYFMPSPMTYNLFNKNCALSSEDNSLVTLFSMQYPNPYSKTPESFNIYIGRLIVKLLLDSRIEYKLYIDEIIWFLPFIKRIDEASYRELISSILEYRTFSYEEKLKLFRESTRDYNDLYANVTHELNYYFLRIFEGFGVLSYFPDVLHNGGNIFAFKHGNGETYRTDSYKSRTKIPGYIMINSKVLKSAEKLNSRFSVFEKPTSMQSSFIYSKQDWINSIYNLEPIQYLSCISNDFEELKEISTKITNMVNSSKYGSRDGKEFEASLKPVMELFDETRNVEILSGSGNTDLLCTMEEILSYNKNPLYKMNVEAKTRKHALDQVNTRRLESHLKSVGSRFCIIVAPKFASGVTMDIAGHRIVTIKAEDLGNYCYKECSSNLNRKACFSDLYKIITQNMGHDITEKVQDLIESKYGVCVR